MKPRDMTPEQSAAYVNATCVVVLSELLSMHWENEQAKAYAEGGSGVKFPFTGQTFQDRMARHCVTHDNVMSLFDSLRKPF